MARKKVTSRKGSRQTTVSRGNKASGNEIEKDETELEEGGTFTSPPAHVSMELGVTRRSPHDEYEFIRVYLRVERPCEDDDEAIEALQQDISEKLTAMLEAELEERGLNDVAEELEEEEVSDEEGEEEEEEEPEEEEEEGEEEEEYAEGEEPLGYLDGVPYWSDDEGYAIDEEDEYLLDDEGEYLLVDDIEPDE